MTTTPATSAATTPILQLRDIHKSLGGHPVLRDVNLAVAPGECIAVLGTNGSGKSTLLRIAAGLLHADAGHRAGPTPGAAAPAGVGYVGHQPALYGHLSAGEQLAWWARLHGHGAATAADALSDAGLRSQATVRCNRLSRGQRQRLAIAQALLPRHDLLVLDEPLTGLDADGAAWLRTALAARPPNAAMLLALHGADVAHRMADRVVRLTATGGLAEVAS